MQLAAAQHAQVALRNRDDLAPEPLHVVAVDPRRAVDQLRRVEEVSRAALVDPDLGLRPAPHERAGGAGMIEVDVRQQDRARHALAERGDQRLRAALRPGIDDHVVLRRAADDALAAEVVHVDQLEIRRPLSASCSRRRSKPRDQDVVDRAAVGAAGPGPVPDADGLEPRFRDPVEQPLLVLRVRSVGRLRTANGAAGERRLGAAAVDGLDRGASSRYALANSAPSGSRMRRDSRSRCTTSSGVACGRTAHMSTKSFVASSNGSGSSSDA